MKERYFKPVSNLDEFKTVDVITTSGEPDTDVPWGQ